MLLSLKPINSQNFKPTSHKVLVVFGEVLKPVGSVAGDHINKMTSIGTASDYEYDRNGRICGW